MIGLVAIDITVIGSVVLVVQLAAMACLGRSAARRCLRIDDPGLAWAAGLPTALAILLVIISIGAAYLPLWGTFGLLLLTLVSAHIWAPEAPPAAESPGFSRALLLTLAASAVIVAFYVHSTQLLGPSDTFWATYPITSSIIEGNIPPLNPYFPDLKLAGRYNAEITTATLSYASGCEPLLTQWILELLLSLNGLFFWALTIRHACGEARAGVFSAICVYFGVNVGPKAGLMDCYDTNNLLVYVLLPLLLGTFSTLLRKVQKHWPVHGLEIVSATLVTSGLASLTESHAILTVICFLIGSLVVARRHQSTARQLAKCGLTIALGTLLLGTIQGGTIHRLTQTWLDNWPITTTNAPRTVENTTTPNSLPKWRSNHFLSIRLGVDPYLRLSNAMDTALFRRYKPVLDDGGYSSIFGQNVLLLHWLPLWLAPLTLAWAISRRNLVGCVLGCFGIIAYLTPGIWHFSDLVETDYLRFEFASGVAFACLLGIFLAKLWEHRPNSRKLNYLLGCLVIALLTADLVGAQRLVNDIVIKMQKQPGALRQIATIGYPLPEKWFLDQNAWGLSPADIQVANWLRNQTKFQKRILYCQQVPTADGLTAIAACAGLARVFPVGQATIPSWQSIGSPPYLPNEAAITFSRSSKPEVLAGLGVNWIVCAEQLTESESHLDSPATLSLAAEFGDFPQKRFVYSLSNLPCPPLPMHVSTGTNTAPVDIITKGLPIPKHCQAGSLYVAQVKTSVPLHGWLSPVLRDQRHTIVNRFCPVTTYIHGDSALPFVVCPLESGQYTLSWAYSKNGTTWQNLDGDTTFGSQFSLWVEECLRVATRCQQEQYLVEVHNIGQHQFWPSEPLTLQWWLWSQDTHGYLKGSIPQGELLINQAIEPGKPLLVTVPIPYSPANRLDVTLKAKYGPNIPISRLP